MTVHMELSRILIRELTDYQVIELREVDGPGDDEGNPRTFPIVIGLPEAQAIERRLSGIPVKRPQTHDLLASVIERLGGQLESIAITDLAEHTFYAELRVATADGETVEIDARPSDAIALGIGVGVPIYVADHVLSAANAPPTEHESFDFDDDEDEGPTL